MSIDVAKYRPIRPEKTGQSTRSTTENSAAARPIVERFTAIDRSYRGYNKWIVIAIVDGREIEVSGTQLYSFNQFRGAALEQEGLYLPPCTKAQWEALAKRRINEAGAAWR